MSLFGAAPGPHTQPQFLIPIYHIPSDFSPQQYFSVQTGYTPMQQSLVPVSHHWNISTPVTINGNSCFCPVMPQSQWFYCPIVQPVSVNIEHQNVGYSTNNHSSHVQDDVVIDSENHTEIKKKVISGIKLMLLLRGCPGSGKTILAKSLKGNGVIHSKDDFFVDQSGDYSFSFDFLDQAHQWNEKCAEESMKKGISPVIIDNTNIETWEMVPYVRLAQLYGYDVMIMEPHTPWKYNVQELSRRNKHGVSRATIRSMLKRYESTTVENLLERASAKNGVESSEEKDCVASLGLFQTSESSSSSQRLDMSDPWQVASGSAGSNKSDGPLPQHEAIRNKDLGVSASLSSMSGDTEVLRDQFSNMGIFSAEQSTNKYVESWIQTNFDKDPETSWLSDTESLEQINKNPLPPNRPWIPKFQRKSARRSATDRIHRSASSGNCSHPKDIFVLSHEKSSSTSWDCVPTPGISWEESHVSKGTGKHPSQSSSALSDCPLPERIKSSRTQKPQNFDSSEASL